MFVNFVSAGGGVTCGLVGYAGFAMTEVPRYAHVISRCAQHRETTRLMKHILSSNTVICSVVYETTYTLTPNPVASRSERDCAQAEYPGSYFENVVALKLRTSITTMTRLNLVAKPCRWASPMNLNPVKILSRVARV